LRERAKIGEEDVLGLTDAGSTERAALLRAASREDEGPFTLFNDPTGCFLDAPARAQFLFDEECPGRRWPFVEIMVEVTRGIEP